MYAYTRYIHSALILCVYIYIYMYNFCVLRHVHWRTPCVCMKRVVANNVNVPFGSPIAEASIHTTRTIDCPNALSSWRCTIARASLGPRSSQRLS